MLKANASDRFYQIGLCSSKAPKLGLVFPVENGHKPLVSIPLALSIGWKNSPPLFCTSTETVADLANQYLHAHAPSRPHKLDDRAAAVISAAAPTLDHNLVPLYQDPLLLCNNAKILVYVDVFVDDLLGLAQGLTHRSSHVRRILFHALYKVFRPLGKLDLPQRKEVLSLKKLDAGDFSWSTYQVLLGWVVDTVNMKLCLPLHLASYLK